LEPGTKLSNKRRLIASLHGGRGRRIDIFAENIPVFFWLPEIERWAKWRFVVYDAFGDSADPRSQGVNHGSRCNIFKQ
jgi:hypothetical protein